MGVNALALLLHLLHLFMFSGVVIPAPASSRIRVHQALDVVLFVSGVVLCVFV
jgi:hypothetical protein